MALRGIVARSVLAIAIAGYLGAAPCASRTESIVYQDNLDLWLLGQVSAVSVNGTVEAATDIDASGRPTAIYQYGRLKQSLGYNTDGTVAWVRDGLGHQTSFGEWKRGIPTAMTFADGTSTSASIDDNGWITSVTDETSATTTYTYDSQGRPRTMTPPGDDTVQWNTEKSDFHPLTAADSKPAGIVDGQWVLAESKGNYRKFTYFDALWRPVLVNEYDDTNIAQTTRSTSKSYDELGRVVFSSYPVSGNVGGSQGIWTNYDPLGRIVAVGQDGEWGLVFTTTSYAGDSGYNTTVIDPKGRQTRTWYQTFDQPSSDAPVRIEAAEGQFTNISRDIFGKPTQIQRRNQDGSVSLSRLYVYDNFQQLCKAVEPETGATAYGYDGAANLIWSASGLALPAADSCDSGAAYGSTERRIDRIYDARNRIKNLIFYDGNGNQTISYTADGLPSEVATQNDGGTSLQVSTFAYNKRRLLVSEYSSETGFGTWAFGYGYDANAVLASVSYPSGMVVTYAPNALGQATRAGTYATDVSYFANGAVKSFVYGNGIVHSAAQNARQLLQRVSESNMLLDDTYSYDEVGNVSQITDAVDPSKTGAFQYDGRDRLVRATSAAFGGNGSIDYTYDVLDNLRSAKLGGATQNTDDIVYYYDGANRLANTYNSGGAMTASVLYDSQGNVTRQNGQDFGFDTGNRLRTVAGKESYRYDGFGRRSIALGLAGQGAIRSFYGRDGILRRQANDREAKIYEYVTLDGRPVARIVTSSAPAAPVISYSPYSYDGSISLSWNAVASATTYKLDRRVDGGNWATLQQASAQSWSATGQAIGTYEFRVSGCQTVCGDPSQVAAIVVQLAPAAAPVISIPGRAPHGNYVVSWTAVSGAQKYVLEESVDAANWAATTIDTPQVSAQYQARPAGRYSYRIRATNDAGDGPLSAVAFTDAVYEPGAPVLSVAANGPGAYIVSWSAVADAASYRLEESVNGGAWNFVPSAGNSYAASSRPNGTYSYRVQACNDVGCGAYSNAYPIMILWPPSAPQTPTAPATSSTGTYTISWNAVPTAVVYQLEESTNGGGWVTIHDEGATQRTVSGRSSATYSYRARASNSSGYSDYSGKVVVVVSLPPPIPATPQNLNAVVTYDNSVRPPIKETAINWSSVPGATYYELSPTADAQPASLWYSGPYNGVELYTKLEKTFYVRACNQSGCSSWAGPVVK